MKKALKAVGFVLILTAVLLYSSSVLKFKHGDGIFNVTQFYRQGKDTVDVLVLGSSHAFENINTGTLWDEHGYAVFELCGSRQPMWNTYYYLKEALKTQTPSIIVLDCYMLTMEDEYSDPSRIIKNNYGLKWSADKLQSLKVSTPGRDYLSYLFEYIQYHYRYSEIKREDYLTDLGDIHFDSWKGFGQNMDLYQMNEPETGDEDSYTEIQGKTKDYYKKIMELANEKGIPILMVVSPYGGYSPEERGIFNNAAKLAKEYGIDFVDFNLYYDDMGLDFSEDISDPDHLNYLGSRKYSAYLGDYLADHFEIPDRRGETGYESWQKEADYIRAEAEDKKFKDNKNVEEIFPMIWDERFSVFLSVDGTCNTSEEKALVMFDALGIEPKGDGGVFYVDNSSKSVISEIRGNEFGKDYFEINGKKIKLERTSDEETGLVVNNIFVGNKSYHNVENGINIVLFDNITGLMVDAFSFDYDRDYSFERM